MLVDRTFGIHLHAIYGDSEMVIGLKPVRVIQGETPAWVRACALAWARQHEKEFPQRLATPRVVLARLQAPRSHPRRLGLAKPVAAQA